MAGSNVNFDTIEQTSIHTVSGNFVVPNRITMLRLLGIGAGAGGNTETDQTLGAEAGDIENLFIPVTPGETVVITIGAGGAGITGAGTPNDGGNTIVATSAKTYNFIGGTGGTFDATENGLSGTQRRYAIDGVSVQVIGNFAPGGQAGYEDGGDAGGTSTDGTNGGIGAGGGCTTDGGQTGGDGGDGRVQLWFRD